MQANVREAALPSPLFAALGRELGISIPVPVSDVWSWRRLATLPSVQQGEDGSEQQVATIRKGYARKASYATGRIHEITRLLLHRHEGPCQTDDGWVWFEVAAPFIIERAEITKRSIYIEALGWAVRYLPYIVENAGLFRLVALINVYTKKRTKAEDDQADLGLPFFLWLPTNDDLLGLLRPTWDEITTLELRGWRAVDRPDADTLKKRSTERRRQQRHDQGVQPQATRTREKDLAATAAGMGISLSTLKRRMRAERDTQIDRKVSGPLIVPCRADRFRSFEPVSQPANDDLPQPPQVMDTDSQPVTAPEPAPTLLDDGYIGRNMSMAAWEVKAAVAKHPNLETDIQVHLDAVDQMMSKTPPEYRKRVTRNLLADRSRLVRRECRDTEAIAA